MRTNRDPRELAVDLLSRSVCNIQVAAVIADKHGIFSWGHNHSGFDGYGMHAECDAIRRSNRNRLKGATIYVASQRKGWKPVMSLPCAECMKRIDKYRINTIWYRDGKGIWHRL